MKDRIEQTNIDNANSSEVLKRGGAYLLTYDTNRTLNRFSDLRGLYLPPITDKFNTDVTLAAQEAFDDSVPIVVIPEAKFYNKMDGMLDLAVKKAGEINGRVVMLDRFIFPIFSPEDSFSNISVSRSVAPDGQVIIKERPGDKSLDQQFDDLEKDILSNGLQRKLVIVDDGLFDVECLEIYEEIFSKRGFEIAGYYVGVSPYGDGDMDTKGTILCSGRFVNDLVLVRNPSDWVCFRDFIFYGGKTRVDSQTSELLTVPYFAPFSDGSGASIPPDRLIDFSKKTLRANIELVSNLQTAIGKELIFTDVITAGYGLPTSTTGEFRQAKPDEKVKDYLDEALISLESGFEKIFSVNGFNGIKLPEIDSETLDTLQKNSNKLIILCGSSGAGRSTLAQAIIDNSPGSVRVRRTTTRERRGGNEQKEIITLGRQNFLKMVDQNEIAGSVYYPPNKEFYGTEIGELVSKLSNLGENEFAVLEGAEDVFKIKALLLEANLVIVLPSSIDAIVTRIRERESGTEEEVNSRIQVTTNQLAITLGNLPSMFKSGIVNMVIVNDEPNIDALKVINTIKGKETMFEDVDSLVNSLSQLKI
jgi:guanylate kinase